MVEEKVQDIAAALGGGGAGTLICNDAGCAMNIDGACQRLRIGHQRPHLRTRHLAELLAEAMGLLPAEGR
jgi:Fe-S oxidoreductase